MGSDSTTAGVYANLDATYLHATAYQGALPANRKNGTSAVIIIIAIPTFTHQSLAPQHDPYRQH
jgi:hypothetical protein